MTLWPHQIAANRAARDAIAAGREADAVKYTDEIGQLLREALAEQCRN